MAALPDCALTYLADQAPVGGTAIAIALGVRWLRMPLPFALNHINLWALEDGDGWTLIDTGFGIEATHLLWQQLFAGDLAGRPVRRIIVTHYHPDHIGAAGWLAERCGVDVWMTEAEVTTAHAVHAGVAPYSRSATHALFRSHGVDACRLEALEARLGTYIRGVPTLPQSIRRLRDGDTIAIGDYKWRIITGYGHAPEHATLYCDATATLISGDQILPRITTNVAVTPHQANGDPLKLFLDTLTRFQPLPAETRVLPSHGLPFTGLHARLAQLRDHHAQRLDELVAAIRRPTTAAELLPVLFNRPLDDHQLSFAMGEIIAHMNHLAATGRVVRVHGDPIRFARR